MSIAIIAPDRDTFVLQKTLQAIFKGVKIFEYPDIPRPAEVEMVVLWKHPKNFLNHFLNLKLICSLGAGVDHIISDHSLPTEVPITRIVDEELTISMRKYVMMCVLNFQKDIWSIFDFNSRKIWRNNPIVEQSLKVGIMGLGALGKDIAVHLKAVGFQVFGYSFSEKKLPGIRCFSKAKNELDLFLGSINVLVNVLPLTDDTKGILNSTLFDKMVPNSFLVNVGRGAHLVDKDLVDAIKNGNIKGAFLDVFNQEPLPKHHLFWQFSEIIMTPHIASITNLENAGTQIAENYRRMMNGEELLNVINVEKGY